MKFIVTTKNKTSRSDFGIRTHTEKPNAALYLLGYSRVNKIKKFVTFVPEKLSYFREVDKFKFFKDYMVMDSRESQSMMYMVKRKEFIESVYRSSKLQNFMVDYNIFITDNPNFAKNRKPFYKKPFPMQKSKDKLIDGVYVPQYRMITEPTPVLKDLQERAYDIIVSVFGYQPNDNIHSYTAGRSNITNAQNHKLSKHFVKLDIKAFFDTITKKFLKTSLHSLKEFAILQIEDINALPQEYNRMKLYHAKTQEFVNAVLDLAMYKNGLPQGSPLSPVLSNIVMAGIDIQLQELANSKIVSKSKMIYTRYADDLTFSSFNPIQLSYLTNYIKGALSNTPLRLHPDKITYLKSNQKVYITGVKINQEQELSYGHEKKVDLKKDIFQALMAVKDNIADLKENQELIGRINYMRQIEPRYSDNLIMKYARKFHVEPSNIYRHLTVL